jgi:hypothetical protein
MLQVCCTFLTLLQHPFIFRHFLYNPRVTTVQHTCACTRRYYCVLLTLCTDAVFHILNVSRLKRKNQVSSFSAQSLTPSCFVSPVMAEYIITRHGASAVIFSVHTHTHTNKIIKSAIQSRHLIRTCIWKRAEC